MGMILRGSKCPPNFQARCSILIHGATALFTAIATPSQSCVNVPSGKHEHLLAGLNKSRLSTNICNKELNRIHCHIRALFTSPSLFTILRKWETCLPV